MKRVSRLRNVPSHFVFPGWRLKYAMAQNMNPNQPLNSELIKLSISEKNGMICAMRNAMTHVAARITVQTVHATKELEWRCLECLNTRKKIKRDVTDEYRDPKKIIVGKANENAIFLKTGWRDPKAGAVIY